MAASSTACLQMGIALAIIINDAYRYDMKLGWRVLEPLEIVRPPLLAVCWIFLCMHKMYDYPWTLQIALELC
jgi:hypothetical protein